MFNSHSSNRDITKGLQDWGSSVHYMIIVYDMFNSHGSNRDITKGLQDWGSSVHSLQSSLSHSQLTRHVRQLLLQ